MDTNTLPAPLAVQIELLEPEKLLFIQKVIHTIPSYHIQSGYWGITFWRHKFFNARQAFMSFHCYIRMRIQHDWQTIFQNLYRRVLCDSATAILAKVQGLNLNGFHQRPSLKNLVAQQKRARLNTFVFEIREPSQIAIVTNIKIAQHDLSCPCCDKYLDPRTSFSFDVKCGNRVDAWLHRRKNWNGRYLSQLRKNSRW